MSETTNNERRTAEDERRDVLAFIRAGNESKESLCRLIERGVHEGAASR